MNSSFRSVQIVINLLEQFEITDVVLSPGGSDIPLIHAIETNDSFNCYSVVDERSAAYFAMGLAQQLMKPVACVCTSGTAVCNYLPGITEAYYQNVPVLAITADKNPYYQGQLETQKIDQTRMFDGVIKKSVSLPLINNEEDEWFCNRLVNEALLELNHHGTGPVHINIPIVGRTDLYTAKEIQHERRIVRVDKIERTDIWNEYSQKLLAAKRVMFIIGQNEHFNDESIKALNVIFENCNCIFAVEHLSNLHCEGCVSTYPISEISGNNILENLLPDLAISIGNNLSAYNLKPFLRLHYKSTENWLVSESGNVRDAFKSLTTIFETNVTDFLQKIALHIQGNYNDNEYYHAWQKGINKVVITEVDFSNLYVAQKVASVIPDNSILHLAILNSTRTMQFFKLPNNVKIYSNVGALGIDGCLSTFAGQSTVTNNLAFLIIGDLSFFYDMNAAGLRSIGSNVRIIMVNNCGGSEFHFFIGKEKIPTINEYICAEHQNVAAGWAISLGYDYYCASDKSELDDAIEKFVKKSDKPMFLEVITDMEDDAKITHDFYNSNKIETGNSIAKKMIKRVLSDNTISGVKNIIKSIKK